jgi:hypothetical protein
VKQTDVSSDGGENKSKLRDAFEMRPRSKSVGLSLRVARDSQRRIATTTGSTRRARSVIPRAAPSWDRATLPAALE